MKENKLEIYINKPVEKVFEYSLESDNVPQWIVSIKEEIPSERPVKLGIRLKNIGVNSSEYEIIDFQPPKTFTLERLNGGYFVKYTCTEKMVEQILNILNGQKTNWKIQWICMR